MRPSTELGKRLESIRVDAGLTRSALGYALGRGAPWVCRVEDGRLLVGYADLHGWLGVCGRLDELDALIPSISRGNVLERGK